MKWRWKGTYIEAGEFGGGYEQITIINRAGGTYKWMDESWKPSRLGSVCVRSGIGQWVVVRAVVVVRAAVVLLTWCQCWWWWCHVSGGGAVVVVVALVVLVVVMVPSSW